MGAVWTDVSWNRAPTLIDLFHLWVYLYVLKSLKAVSHPEPPVAVRAQLKNNHCVIVTLTADWLDWWHFYCKLMMVVIKNNLIYVGSFTQVFEKKVPSLPSVHLSKFDLTHDWNMSKSIDQCHVCSHKRQDQVPLISFGSCHFVSTLTVILGVRVQGFLFAALDGRLERETMSCSLKWKCPVWGFVVVLHNAVEEKHMGDQHRLLTASILMPPPTPSPCTYTRNECIARGSAYILVCWA